MGISCSYARPLPSLFHRNEKLRSQRRTGSACVYSENVSNSSDGARWDGGFGANARLLSDMLALRSRVAAREGLAPYMIFNEETLARFAVRLSVILSMPQFLVTHV